MRRRALLASAGTAALAASAGCLSDARRAYSGDVRSDHGYARLHPAGEPAVRESFPGGTDVRGWVFADPPADQTDVFTERAMQGEYSNDLLWAEGSSFALLFEVRMPPEEAAFYNVALSPRWTGWGSVEIPIRRSPATDGVDTDADELVCTSLSAFELDRGPAPSTATLTVRDRETDATLGSYRVARWADR